jgi:hypothetical protein
MIDAFVKNFPIEKLQEDAESMLVSTEAQYLTAYQEFIEYFKSVTTITRHNTIIGISFTYSWMPTILDFRSNEIEEATAILNRAKNGRRPSLLDLEVLKKCFNNSLVGSSKLLHFINPDIFAIWDSRVCRYLLNKEAHSYRVENITTYLNYLSFCDHLVSDPNIDKVHKIVEQKIGYELSKMRAIELIFFYNGARAK